MHHRIRIMFSLIALAVVGALATDLETHIKEQQAITLENWTAEVIVLSRHCKAKWPIPGKRFDNCIKKVHILKGFRRDI